ncbi:MAG: 50S ribosomal protein L10 [Fimbriimonadales bacterium]|nr:MAG: 50S ribosomal protein L10 [Fimbriimonadales bacterium]
MDTTEVVETTAAGSTHLQPRWEPKAGGKKKEQVSQIRAWIRESKAQIFVDYRSLNVREITDLRKQLRQAGAELRVVKNTLYRIAREGNLPAALEPYLHGMTAIAFVSGDEAAAAKALTDYIKQARKAEVKALLLGERVYPADMVDTLAKLPPREVMIAQFLGALQSPITGLVGTLSELIGQFVRTLQAVADKKAETQS